MLSQGLFGRQTSACALRGAEIWGERIKRTIIKKYYPEILFLQQSDFKLINNIQERPCNTLIGVRDADHCGSQDVRNNPKSSDGSRLPEEKKTQKLCG